MVFAVRPEKGFRWVCSDDEGVDEDRQTWFLLDTPDHATCTRLMDSIRMSGSLHQFAVGSRIDLLVRACLVGIDDDHPMTDPETGNAVGFETDAAGRVSDDTLSRIPWPVKREMSEELQSRVLVVASDVEKLAPSSEDS
jgi:hypothetical protein